MNISQDSAVKLEKELNQWVYTTDVGHHGCFYTPSHVQKLIRAGKVEGKTCLTSGRWIVYLRSLYYYMLLVSPRYYPPTHSVPIPLLVAVTLYTTPQIRKLFKGEITKGVMSGSEVVPLKSVRAKLGE